MQYRRSLGIQKSLGWSRNLREKQQQHGTVWEVILFFLIGERFIGSVRFLECCFMLQHSAEMAHSGITNLPAWRQFPAKTETERTNTDDAVSPFLIV